MKKHPWLCFLAILLVAGLVIGISAADLWQYIIDFMKIGVDLIVKWIDELIRALRDSITSVTKGSGETSSVVETTTSFIDNISDVVKFS